jgi:uncharacterized membrane protein (UPF0127 family)
MQKYRKIPIWINGKRFDALIADTLIKRMIGLMFRKRLEKNQCMLFTFFSEGYQSIWMYNMRFAIDVVWASSALKIVDIKENMQPCSSISKCRAYIPKARAKYVIEFNSGAVKNSKIKESSKIKFNLRA